MSVHNTVASRMFVKMYLRKFVKLSWSSLAELSKRRFAQTLRTQNPKKSAIL